MIHRGELMLRVRLLATKVASPLTGFAFAGLFATSACEPDRLAPDLQRERLIVIEQPATAHVNVDDRVHVLAVRVLDRRRRPVPDVAVSWSVASGDGKIEAPSGTTDRSGRAEAIWVTGTLLEDESVIAETARAQPAVFSRPALPCTATVPSGFAEHTFVSHRHPQIICIPPSPVLRRMGLVITAPVAAVGSRTLVELSTSGVDFGPRQQAGLSAGPQPEDSFHDQLRVNERRLAAERLAVAPVQPAELTVRVPEVGALLTVNTQARFACAAPVLTTGRVVAVGRTAIVLADTANPTGGFTNADFAEFATAFDSLVIPTITEAFGALTDIDRNGRVIIYFTKEVNALTPMGSTGIINGFVFARDLLRRAECNGSNEAELVYLLVPDPAGAINGNVRTKRSVSDRVLGTTAHEVQHLINAGRRLYRPGGQLEEVWLDEGLSHVAEELLYYRVSGLSPLRSLGSVDIDASAWQRNAFNSFQFSNFGRLRLYLENPEATSPFNGSSLAARGAVWAYLRFAADQLNVSGTQIWYRLANSSLTGTDNLTDAFGNNPLELLHLWGVHLLREAYAEDSLEGNRRSWQLASVFRSLGTPRFPLAARSPAVDSRITIAAGAVAMLSFDVLPDRTVRVRVSSGDLALPLLHTTVTQLR